MREYGVHKITPSLLPLAVDITDLKEDPKNARAHGERSIASISESLRVFGQRKPIIAHVTTHVVIAGNGTLRAAKSLGWSKIAVVWVEDDRETATAYAIADNRTAELSTWDEQYLKEALALVNDAGGDILDAVGFSTTEMDKYLAESISLGNDLLSGPDPELMSMSDTPPEKLPETPSVRFGKWVLYMDKDDATLLEGKLKAYIDQMGSSHGFAGRLVRAC